MSKKEINGLRKVFMYITLMCYIPFLFLFIFEDYQSMPFTYVFGFFLVQSRPPIVCWVIYVIILFVQKQKNKNLYKKIVNKIDTSTEYGKEFKTSIDALNDLLFVKEITIEEFETKKKLLILVNQTENLKMNQMQAEKLSNAWDLGVISKDEYFSKIKKLSDEWVTIKQQIERIKSN